jgi:diacylglycerol kinase family enzyme
MLSRGGLVEDEGIKHYRAKNVKIVSDPQMPVLADGTLLSQGSLSIHIHPGVLKVMAGTELTGQPVEQIVMDQKLEIDE